MYVVRNKKSKKILHINPAPLSQELDGTDIYHAFDSKKMEIGRWDGPVLPEHFKIDDQGQVIGLSLKEKVEKGFVKLEPHQKVEDGEIVEKTLSEKVADGLLTLEPTQKIVGKGKNERIVGKSLGEMVADGQLSAAEVKDQTLRRLRREIGTHFQETMTPSGHFLDDLARQKAIFSYPFRDLPDTDERKKELQDAGLIYPDAVVDEILAEVGKVQTAYRAAKAALSSAVEKGEPVEEWDAISLQDHLPGAKGKKPKETTGASKKKTPSTKPKKGGSS